MTGRDRDCSGPRFSAGRIAGTRTHSGVQGAAVATGCLSGLGARAACTGDFFGSCPASDSRSPVVMAIRTCPHSLWVSMSIRPLGGHCVSCTIQGSIFSFADWHSHSAGVAKSPRRMAVRQSRAIRDRLLGSQYSGKRFFPLLQLHIDPKFCSECGPARGQTRSRSRSLAACARRTHRCAGGLCASHPRSRSGNGCLGRQREPGLGGFQPLG